MNTILIATLGGLGTLIFWGVSDWLVSKASKSTENSLANLTVQLPGIIIMLLLSFFISLEMPNMRQALTIFIASLFWTIAYITYVKAMSVGEAGVVTPLANTYPMLVILFSVTFLSLNLAPMQLSSMIIVALGAVMLGTEKIKQKSVSGHLTTEVIFAMLTALFWAIGFIIIDSVVEDLPWETLVIFIAFFTALTSFIYFLLRNLSNFSEVKSVWKNKVGLASGVALTIGSITFYVAAEVSGSIVIPAVIGSASPLVTSLLAYRFDNETLALAKRIGAVLVVFGIMLLNL